jgi:hypothetical protein
LKVFTNVNWQVPTLTLQKVSDMRKDIDVKREWIVEQLGLGVSRLSLCQTLGCKYETLAG